MRIEKLHLDRAIMASSAPDLTHVVFDPCGYINQPARAQAGSSEPMVTALCPERGPEQPLRILSCHGSSGKQPAQPDYGSCRPFRINNNVGTTVSEGSARPQAGLPRILQQARAFDDGTRPPPLALLAQVLQSVVGHEIPVANPVTCPIPLAQPGRASLPPRHHRRWSRFCLDPQPFLWRKVYFEVWRREFQGQMSARVFKMRLGPAVTTTQMSESGCLTRVMSESARVFKMRLGPAVTA
jgi:hypothetical protein